MKRYFKVSCVIVLTLMISGLFSGFVVTQNIDDCVVPSPPTNVTVTEVVATSTRQFYDGDQVQLRIYSFKGSPWTDQVIFSSTYYETTNMTIVGSDVWLQLDYTPDPNADGIIVFVKHDLCDFIDPEAKCSATYRDPATALQTKEWITNLNPVWIQNQFLQGPTPIEPNTCAD